MHLATRIPLIIKMPGKNPGSTQSLVEASDIFPTLCSLAGIDVPKTVQGRSFSVLLDQPDQPFRDVVYNRFGAGDCVITEQFTYTSYSGGKSEMLYNRGKDPAGYEAARGLSWLLIWRRCKRHSRCRASSIAIPRTGLSPRRHG